MKMTWKESYIYWNQYAKLTRGELNEFNKNIVRQSSVDLNNNKHYFISLIGHNDSADDKNQLFTKEI